MSFWLEEPDFVSYVMLKSGLESSQAEDCCTSPPWMRPSGKRGGAGACTFYIQSMTHTHLIKPGQNIFFLMCSTKCILTMYFCGFVFYFM